VDMKIGFIQTLISDAAISEIKYLDSKKGGYGIPMSLS
jgi:hypothetical protein